MTDLFEDFTITLDSPPTRLYLATPSDTTDLPLASRAVNVATSGTIRVTTTQGDVATIFVAAGVAFPVRASRIWSTDTTATGIVVML